MGQEFHRTWATDERGSRMKREKAIAYYRVSARPGRALSGLGLEAQEAAVTALCKARAGRSRKRLSLTLNPEAARKSARACEALEHGAKRPRPCS